MNRSTDELMDSLANSEDIESFLSDNSSELDSKGFTDYLSELTDRRGVNKGDIIKEAQINPVYGYQIYSGTRVPTKNKIIALALAL
ncbi:MAG: hypothetical protein IJ737_00290 [Ruminococcus sp.]|nr:hypothetical protein [Ruminococcus sp.]